MVWSFLTKSCVHGGLKCCFISLYIKTFDIYPWPLVTGLFTVPLQFFLDSVQVQKALWKSSPVSLVALTFTLKQDFLARVGHTVRLSADSLTVLLVFAKKVNLTHWIWTADSAAFMWWFAINRAGSHHVLLCGWLEHFPCMGQILIKMQISVLFMRSEVPVQLYF